jgi:hypothetical protein
MSSVAAAANSLHGTSSVIGACQVGESMAWPAPAAKVSSSAGGINPGNGEPGEQGSYNDELDRYAEPEPATVECVGKIHCAPTICAHVRHWLSPHRARARRTRDAGANDDIKPDRWFHNLG